ncbi:hypothetical protein RHMOL_Rhmol05G0204500 [Rhododendron molle]|uniref:Uncharacterized protein n=1 Tax=Rhododendron molle TaxID=49168 RepID=A0ACC0NR50_RHOML|nr:hypothetical protein RHMOL_Rhmol05G0204500 [Rhododendron molle]
MVFTREHKELVVEGQKWMKDTANPFSIAAALIVTVVFAAIITVPSGNNNDIGLPIFSKKTAFIAFAVSDAISHSLHPPLLYGCSCLSLLLAMLNRIFAMLNWIFSMFFLRD